jgi:hypothetical protein
MASKFSWERELLKGVQMSFIRLNPLSTTAVDAEMSEAYKTSLYTLGKQVFRTFL